MKYSNVAESVDTWSLGGAQPLSELVECSGECRYEESGRSATTGLKYSNVAESVDTWSLGGAQPLE